MKSAGILAFVAVLGMVGAAQASCSHVPGETFYFQGTEAPDYFTFEHNFDVQDATTDVVWRLQYCVSLDDGQGGYVEYAHDRYFYQDSGSHLSEMTGKAIDDNPTYVADFDRFPLSYTDLLFYAVDDPNSTSNDYVRMAFGANDDTIVVTVSARMAPYSGAVCSP